MHAMKLVNGQVVWMLCLGLIVFLIVFKLLFKNNKKP
jgi:hypothetical protein